jgi:RHS repeat-associated protein
VTKRIGGDVWSYPNIHGDTAATANASGTKQGNTLTWDPYGNPLVAVPDNSDGNYDYGYLGQHQRGLEHEPSLQPVVEMGARPYHPTLGRFLGVDPVLGGSCNDYEYTCGDPINRLDLAGECWQDTGAGYSIWVDDENLCGMTPAPGNGYGGPQGPTGTNGGGGTFVVGPTAKAGTSGSGGAPLKPIDVMKPMQDLRDPDAGASCSQAWVDGITTTAERNGMSVSDFFPEASGLVKVVLDTTDEADEAWSQYEGARALGRIARDCNDW